MNQETCEVIGLDWAIMCVAIMCIAIMCLAIMCIQVVYLLVFVSKHYKCAELNNYRQL